MNLKYVHDFFKIGNFIDQTRYFLRKYDNNNINNNKAPLLWRYNIVLSGVHKISKPRDQHRFDSNCEVCFDKPLSFIRAIYFYNDVV